MQAALDAAGDDVCSVVIRLPQFVWGNRGSFFIPHQIATAQRLQKAFYPLPGKKRVPVFSNRISKQVALTNLEVPNVQQVR